MKKIPLLFIAFIFCNTFVSAQADYFYYYKGEKQYLELDTKYIFISVKDSKALDVLSEKVDHSSLKIDISEAMQWNWQIDFMNRDTFNQQNLI